MAAFPRVRRSKVVVTPLAYDFETASKIAGCSGRHLRKYLPDGPAEFQPKLPAVRLGHKLLIRAAALESWLAAAEQLAAVQPG